VPFAVFRGVSTDGKLGRRTVGDRRSGGTPEVSSDHLRASRN
jgi:hypothetical protein